MKPKISMKKYMNELNKMTGKEKLEEYLITVMPLYLSRSYGKSYSVSLEELKAMTLKEYNMLEILELIDSILLERFDEAFDVEYEDYWYQPNGQFIKITLVK